VIERKDYTPSAGSSSTLSFSDRSRRRFVSLAFPPMLPSTRSPSKLKTVQSLQAEEGFEPTGLKNGETDDKEAPRQERKAGDFGTS